MSCTINYVHRRKAHFSQFSFISNLKGYLSNIRFNKLVKWLNGAQWKPACRECLSVLPGIEIYWLLKGLLELILERYPNTGSISKIMMGARQRYRKRPIVSISGHTHPHWYPYNNPKNNWVKKFFLCLTFRFYSYWKWWNRPILVDLQFRPFSLEETQYS